MFGLSVWAGFGGDISWACCGIVGDESSGVAASVSEAIDDGGT